MHGLDVGCGKCRCWGTAQQRFAVLQGSLGSFSAGVSVDRGRDGVGKERRKGRGNGVEIAWSWLGISTGRKASLEIDRVRFPVQNVLASYGMERCRVLG